MASYSNYDRTSTRHQCIRFDCLYLIEECRYLAISLGYTEVSGRRRACVTFEAFDVTAEDHRFACMLLTDALKLTVVRAGMLTRCLSNVRTTL